MKALIERNIDAYGFDIINDKSLIIDSKDDIIRNHFEIGSILNIPHFNRTFDLLTCIDVFEHIPINYVSTMIENIKHLGCKYLCIQISTDMFNDGHITLKSTRFWVDKFSPEYILVKDVEKNSKI